MAAKEKAGTEAAAEWRRWAAESKGRTGECEGEEEEAGEAQGRREAKANEEKTRCKAESGEEMKASSKIVSFRSDKDWLLKTIKFVRGLLDFSVFSQFLHIPPSKFRNM